MIDSQFVRSHSDKASRHFYLQSGQDWFKQDFSNIVQGTRFFYIENGVRSAVRIAYGEPFHHPNYKCLVVESIAAYVMEQTTTLAEVSKVAKASLNGGIRPVYVNIQGRVVAISNVTIGVHGELFLHTAENDAPHIKYSDDLPVMPTRIPDVVIEAEFADATDAQGVDTSVHQSNAA